MPDVAGPTLQPTRRVIGDVDPAQPLDTTHPLLRGVQGFWLPLPSTSEGSRLYDLSGYGLDARLKGTATWGASSDFIFPALDFDGSGARADEVDMPILGPDVTLTAIFLARGVTNDGTLIGGFSSNDPLFWVGNGSIDFIWDDNSKPRPSASVSKNTFYTATAVNDTARDVAEVWLNGELEASDAGAGTKSKDRNFSFGTDNSGSTSRAFDGLWFFGSIHNRSLSESEIRSYHSQARRGFPDLLRTRSSPALVSTSGGGGEETRSLSTGTIRLQGGDLSVSEAGATRSLSTGAVRLEAGGVTVTEQGSPQTVTLQTGRLELQAGTLTATEQAVTRALATGTLQLDAGDLAVTETSGARAIATATVVLEGGTASVTMAPAKRSVSTGALRLQGGTVEIEGLTITETLSEVQVKYTGLSTVRDPIT